MFSTEQIAKMNAAQVDQLADCLHDAAQRLAPVALEKKLLRALDQRLAVIEKSIGIESPAEPAPHWPTITGE